MRCSGRRPAQQWSRPGNIRCADDEDGLLRRIRNTGAKVPECGPEENRRQKAMRQNRHFAVLRACNKTSTQQLGPLTVTSSTPPWLALGLGCRDRRLPKERGNSDMLPWLR